MLLNVPKQPRLRKPSGPIVGWRISAVILCSSDVIPPFPACSAVSLVGSLFSFTHHTELLEVSGH